MADGCCCCCCCCCGSRVSGMEEQERQEIRDKNENDQKARGKKTKKKKWKCAGSGGLGVVDWWRMWTIGKVLGTRGKRERKREEGKEREGKREKREGVEMRWSDTRRGVKRRVVKALFFRPASRGVLFVFSSIFVSFLICTNVPSPRVVTTCRHHVSSPRVVTTAAVRETRAFAPPTPRGCLVRDCCYS